VISVYPEGVSQKELQVTTSSHPQVLEARLYLFLHEVAGGGRVVAVVVVLVDSLPSNLSQSRLSTFFWAVSSLREP